ncbi:RHE_PE00001 family protein [Roseibium sp. SCP14]|uniref:RHE_PE00001 family protein n=1 Tax=Roseibium sp. SCP14 TaxID=3141375 RepID=UPI0033374E70
MSKLDWSRLALPMDAAGRELTRADERLKRSSELADGIRARGHILDACAGMWLDGDLVHLEDLVLHDAGADVRAPTHELTLAARLLRLRRTVERQDFDWVFSRAGLLALAGRGGQARAGSDETSFFSEAADATLDDEDEVSSFEDDLLAEIDAIADRAQKLADSAASAAGRLEGHRLDSGNASKLEDLLGDPDHDETQLLNSWHRVVEDTRALPPVLGAALILDAWLVLEPLERRSELGRLIAAAALRRSVTPNHLPLVAVGLRQSKFRWRRSDPVQTRLSMLLTGFEVGAQETMEQMNRLHFAREHMLRQCQNCRRNSKLPQLVDLFIAHPFVSIPLARKKLKVTAAAVDRMLEQLGSALPRELTGRGRYRAWGVL